MTVNFFKKLVETSASGGTQTPPPTQTPVSNSVSTQSSNMPIWLQMDSYKDIYDDSSNIEEKDVSDALNRVVAFEVSEKGKADTLFYSDKYNQGFTHNGKVVNGSCTEGGMKKAIIGGEKYITVTNAEGETMSGVEAMADSYDSVLDLYTQAQFEKVLEEYGWGTFGDGCQFMKPENLADIRKKYGIDIKMVETKNADGSRAVAGIQDRTFEISLIDKDGNIIEDAEGKKSTILFGDWVIPDGCAQGAEFDFISVIDQAGYDCISKADFIDNPAFASNPEFQTDGQYDPGKAYAYVLGQIEGELGKNENGTGSDILHSGDENYKTYKGYTGCTFTWWSAGGDGGYYANSGLSAEFAGGLSSEQLAAMDTNGDGIISDEEASVYGETSEATDDEDKKKTEEAEGTNNANQASQQAGAQQTSQAEITYSNINEVSYMIAEAQAENPDADIQEIVTEYAEDNNLDADELWKQFK